MIRSMTGVGRAEASIPHRGIKITWEIRSSNHRFLELNMKLPPILDGYENKVREIVRQNVFRGTLQLSVTIQGSDNGKTLNSNQPRLLTLDTDLLNNLIRISKKLKEDYNISGELNVNTVISFPGIVVPAKTTEVNKNEMLWARTKSALVKALTALNKMKREEGTFLYRDFIKRINNILKLLKDIEKRTKIVREEIKEKILEERTSSIQSDNNKDIENQLFPLTKSDITEERIRLLSHTKAFIRAIKSKRMQSVGRKLEFILSEMLRETETMLAKARDTAISRDGIAIKEEIDALKEQVRNVE
ncbi:MAG: YicC/YloC family endoribonuclease [candidate division WOR-3 bacterium]